MNKLSEIIGNLSLNELNLIKQDLDEGNIHKLINKRLKREDDKISICPVCGAEIDKNTAFILEFGKEIRKRAFFDELDCLNYFIRQLKQ